MGDFNLLEVQWLIREQLNRHLGYGYNKPLRERRRPGTVKVALISLAPRNLGISFTKSQKSNKDQKINEVKQDIKGDYFENKFKLLEDF